jgi:phytanoyl-CoA hydroxylase
MTRSLGELAIARELRTTLDRDGFAVADRIVPAATVELLAARLDQVLDRRYETGVFPDEAYYRPGTTDPRVPRHVVNAWKCDRLVAAVSLSAALGELAAAVFGWDGLRLAVDTVWFKPAGCQAVEYHREFEYFTSLDRPDVASCWIALDDVQAGNGSLEFVTGSHRWDELDQAEQFDLFSRHHGRDGVRAVAQRHGNPVTIETVDVPAGGGAFFHGRIWHGSQPNASELPRRAYGIHWIRADAELRADQTARYLFGRYKLAGTTALHESFFPLVWSADGRRSAWIEPFLAGGPLGG